MCASVGINAPAESTGVTEHNRTTRLDNANVPELLGTLRGALATRHPRWEDVEELIGRLYGKGFGASAEGTASTYFRDDL